jgi:hypothetical protein
MIATSEHLNIKDLVVSEVSERSKWPLDPREILSESKKGVIERLVNSFLTDVNPDKYYLTSNECEFLGDVSVGIPNMVSPKVDENAWMMLKNGFVKVPWAERPAYYSNLINIAPERVRNDKNLVIDWALYEENFISHPSAIVKLSEASRIAVIDPIRAYKLRLNEDAWDKIKNYVSAIQENRDWNKVVKTLADIKLVDPERLKSEYILTRDAKKTLLINTFPVLEKNLNNANFATSVSILRDMTIIAADKVRITDRGMELVMPRPVKQLVNAAKFPERRKF